VNLGRPGVIAAALALAATLLVPGPASASWLEVAEKVTADAEARLAQVATSYDRPDETPAARARRQFTAGEAQFQLGDWLHATVLLYGALEEAGFQASPDAPRALLHLGDSLRHQGSCGSALGPYQEVLRQADATLRTAALIGTLDCRIKLRRVEDLQPLLDAARAELAGGQPAELAYLIGKATAFRTDLSPGQRLEQGLTAFGAVGPPYHLAAAYFQGSLLVEAGALGAAGERFEACLALRGDDPKQVEIRELCAMAAARVYAAQGKFAESLDRYQLVPLDSPRLDESLYETAWGHVRAGRQEQALRTVSMILDLAPGSRLAPEATILTGHLQLRLGRYGEAGESFNRVINTYSPVRDEIDAVVNLVSDPAQYFKELIGRQGKAFEVASVLPPVAVQWASAQPDVGRALEVAAALDATRQDLVDSFQVINRVDALLNRGEGLDAVPLARDGWINADAIENGTARVRGQIADRAADLAAPQLSPAGRAELERLRQARRQLQPRLDQLPRTGLEVEARARRMRTRVDLAQKAAFQLAVQVDGAEAAVAGIEAWVIKYRLELGADSARRGELGAELREHRGFVSGYAEALRTLRQEIAEAHDAAGGMAQALGDASLRQEYLALVVRERALVRPVVAALARGDAEELARGAALGDRLDRADAAAERLKDRFAAVARRNAVAVGGWVAAERSGLLRQQEELAQADGEAREVVGRIALGSFRAVSAQLYRLVLKADVGIVDVAWSRKRERVDRIQQISRQKTSELESLDRDFRTVLREVE
jgi:tetratricopeptide (TPR) repeat protein